MSARGLLSTLPATIIRAWDILRQDGKLMQHRFERVTAIIVQSCVTFSTPDSRPYEIFAHEGTSAALYDKIRATLTFDITGDDDSRARLALGEPKPWETQDKAVNTNGRVAICPGTAGEDGGDCDSRSMHRCAPTSLGIVTAGLVRYSLSRLLKRTSSRRTCSTYFRHLRRRYLASRLRFRESEAQKTAIRSPDDHNPTTRDALLDTPEWPVPRFFRDIRYNERATLTFGTLDSLNLHTGLTFGESRPREIQDY